MINSIFSKQHKLIISAINELCSKEIAPEAGDIDQNGTFPWRNFTKLAEQGFAGMNVPEELNGGQMDPLSFVLAIEEIAKACASTALITVSHHFVTQGIWVAGDSQQKTKYLPKLAKGELLGAFAVHEPGAGCVAPAIETQAMKKDNGFVLSGSKFFTTSAGEASIYLVMAVTDKSKGPAGLSMFLIDKDTKGLSFGKVYNRLGFKGTSGRDTYLDECFVPMENLLGVEGEGLKYLGAIVGKYIFLGAGAISLGIAEAALRDSIQHVKTRTIAGKTLSEHQAVAFTISEMSQLVNSAKSLLYAAAMGGGNPVEPSPLWTMQAKIYASEIAVKVTNMAIQLHGGHGYCSDLPIERYLRDARGLTMHIGTSELLKINVANALIK